MGNPSDPEFEFQVLKKVVNEAVVYEGGDAVLVSELNADEYRALGSVLARLLGLSMALPKEPHPIPGTLAAVFAAQKEKNTIVDGLLDAVRAAGDKALRDWEGPVRLSWAYWPNRIMEAVPMTPDGVVEQFIEDVRDMRKNLGLSSDQPIRVQMPRSVADVIHANSEKVLAENLNFVMDVSDE